MAKTTSPAYKTAFASKGYKVAVYKIAYLRRYWNGAAYVYEPNWHYLTMPGAQFASIGTLTWNIDTALQDEFTASNATLSLLNTDYRWLPENPSGIFGYDGVHTYFARGTKFIIYAGYEVNGGTQELLPMFSGLLTDYSAKPMEGTFEAIISGYEDWLINSDAQLVATTFTNEALVGAVDGVNKIFTTASLGVAFVTRVRDNAVVGSEGSGYSISGTDTPGVGATITFVVAPTAGHALDASGTIWKASQAIDVLAGLLCTQAGITAANRNIQTVLFPNGVVSKFTINTKTLFDQGTYSDASCDAAGYLKFAASSIDDFEAGIGAWAQSGTAWSASGAGLGAACTTGAAYNSNLPSYLSKASVKATGTWQIRLNGNNGHASRTYYGFMSSSSTGFGNGYVLGVDTLQSLTPGLFPLIKLYRSDAGVLTELASWINPNGVVVNGLVSVTVTRDGSGNFSLFCADNSGDNMGNTGPTVTDNTYTTSTFAVLNFASLYAVDDGYTINVCVYDLFTYTDTVYPYAFWVSKEQDSLGVTAWSTVDGVLTTPNAFDYPKVTTRVSNSSGAGYDAYVANPIYTAPAYDVGGQIASAVKRYFQARVALRWDSTNINSLTCAQLTSVVINYSTNVTAISLAVFRGDTCYSALQKLAFMCDYEIGFDSVGSFFFLPKTLAAGSTLTFKQSDILSRVVEIKPGWMEVVNTAQVQYGQYYKEYNSTTLPEASPTSKDKYGTQINNQTVPFIFVNDGNIALGLAQVIHDSRYIAQRRVSIECRILPHVDIGDTLTISFFEDPLLENNYFGDPLVTWAPFFGDAPAALRAFKFKVIQLTHDFDSGLSRILGLEALS